MTGCTPPPRGGFSPCVRTLCMREAGASRSTTRVYDFSINLGHGRLGLPACPITKSEPEPEYSMVFRFSAPSALDAVPIKALGSCPPVAPENTAQDNRVNNETATIHFLAILASTQG